MPDNGDARAHYNSMLARHYVWMAGGWDAGTGKNRRFFEEHAIRPNGSGIAVDLGAGCGFGSIALAGAGFGVIAVDFCLEMLDILEQQAGDLPVRTVHADILNYRAWSGEKPELITIMGDTLTHLPDMDSVKDLIWRCAHELDPGGRVIVSCRDYSQEPAGSSVVIPLRRDTDRIFLCRLGYGADQVVITDILYTRESGKWERVFGIYPKIRIAPDILAGMLAAEDFVIVFNELRDGMITLIGQKC